MYINGIFHSMNRVCFVFTADEIKSDNQLNTSKVAKQQRRLSVETQNRILDWKFDYFYDWKNRGKSQVKPIHGIYDNNKTVKCKCSDKHGCYCFTRISFGMKPNTGIYKIKMKIKYINNQSHNVIGITCNKHETNNSHYGNLWYYSHDYIGWTSRLETEKQGINIPNGLLCGHSYQKKNIFVLSRFEYRSNNKAYSKRLPSLKTGDTIEMLYDSYNCQLSFLRCFNAHEYTWFKSKDLNSTITNLPKDKIFYWMVGHSSGKMSVTIVD